MSKRSRLTRPRPFFSSQARAQEILADAHAEATLALLRAASITSTVVFRDPDTNALMTLADESDSRIDAKVKPVLSASSDRTPACRPMSLENATPASTSTTASDIWPEVVATTADASRYMTAVASPTRRLRVLSPSSRCPVVSPVVLRSRALAILSKRSSEACGGPALTSPGFAKHLSLTPLAGSVDGEANGASHHKIAADIVLVPCKTTAGSTCVDVEAAVCPSTSRLSGSSRPSSRGRSQADPVLLAQTVAAVTSAVQTAEAALHAVGPPRGSRSGSRSSSASATRAGSRTAARNGRCGDPLGAAAAAAAAAPTAGSAAAGSAAAAGGGELPCAGLESTSATKERRSPEAAGPAMEQVIPGSDQAELPVAVAMQAAPPHAAFASVPPATSHTDVPSQLIPCASACNDSCVKLSTGAATDVYEHADAGEAIHAVTAASVATQSSAEAAVLQPRALACGCNISSSHTIHHDDAPQHAVRMAEGESGRELSDAARQAVDVRPGCSCARSTRVAASYPSPQQWHGVAPKLAMCRSSSQPCSPSSSIHVSVSCTPSVSCSCSSWPAGFPAAASTHVCRTGLRPCAYGHAHSRCAEPGRESYGRGELPQHLHYRELPCCNSDCCGHPCGRGVPSRTSPSLCSCCGPDHALPAGRYNAAGLTSSRSRPHDAVPVAAHRASLEHERPSCSCGCSTKLQRSDDTAAVAKASARSDRLVPAAGSDRVDPTAAGVSGAAASDVQTDSSEEPARVTAPSSLLAPAAGSSLFAVEGSNQAAAVQAAHLSGSEPRVHGGNGAASSAAVTAVAGVTTAFAGRNIHQTAAHFKLAAASAGLISDSEGVGPGLLDPPLLPPSVHGGPSVRVAMLPTSVTSASARMQPTSHHGHRVPVLVGAPALESAFLLRPTTFSSEPSGSTMSKCLAPGSSGIQAPSDAAVVSATSTVKGSRGAAFKNRSDVSHPAAPFHRAFAQAHAMMEELRMYR